MGELREAVWAILGRTRDKPTPDKIDAIVELVNTERRKAYNAGHHEGVRHADMAHHN